MASSYFGIEHMGILSVQDIELEMEWQYKSMAGVFNRGPLGNGIMLELASHSFVRHACVVKLGCPSENMALPKN